MNYEIKRICYVCVSNKVWYVFVFIFTSAVNEESTDTISKKCIYVYKRGKLTKKPIHTTKGFHRAHDSVELVSHNLT